MELEREFRDITGIASPEVARFYFKWFGSNLAHCLNGYYANPDLHTEAGAEGGMGGGGASSMDVV